MSKPALLVVDMLDDFVTGKLANQLAPAIVPAIKSLCTKAANNGDLIIFGNDAHQKGDLELERFGEHAMAGTQGARVVPELGRAEFRYDPIYVPKRYYSAFTETDLATTLFVNEVTDIIIVGQHTDCCVRHTAYDAWRMGYRIHVVSDATCVYLPKDVQATTNGFLDVATREGDALTYLQTYYGAVISPARDIYD